MTMGKDGKKEIAPPNMKVAIKQPAKSKKEDIWDEYFFHSKWWSAISGLQIKKRYL